jgi:hypothetical protein
MRSEQEAGDHTEVAAAPAQRPQQIRVGGLAGDDKTADGKHHVRLDEAVDRQPILPAAIAVTAREGETCNARRRDDAERHRKAEGMRRMVDVAGLAARPDAHRLVDRIDAHAGHHREADDEPALDAAEPGTAVKARQLGRDLAGCVTNRTQWLLATASRCTAAIFVWVIATEVPAMVLRICTSASN